MVRRRRCCDACEARFTTYEIVVPDEIAKRNLAILIAPAALLDELRAFARAIAAQSLTPTPEAVTVTDTVT